MKKIKFLNGLLIIFIILTTLGITSNLIISIYYKDPFLGQNQDAFYSFYSSIFLSCVLVFGMYQVQQALSSFIKNSYFNSKSAKFLKRGGIILIANGVLSIVYNLGFSSSDLNLKIINYIMYAIIIMVGIGLMAVSDIISKGEIIEQENFLTI